MTLKGVIMPAPGATNADGRPDAALLRVGNRPIVCHVLEAVRRAGAREVALIVSARELAPTRACVTAEGPADVEVELLAHARRPGSLQDALARAVELVGEDPCVVHAADGLLAQPLQPFAERLREDAADLMLLAHRPAGAGGSASLASRRLLRLAGVAPHDCTAELAGVCLFGAGALARVAHVGLCRGEELDLTGAAGHLTRAGGRLRVEHVRGWHRYGGTAADLLELNRLVLEALMRGAGAAADGLAQRLADGRRGGEDDGSRIEGCVELHPSACVQSSVIVGPAIVGAGALVQDSYIGPYTSIGAGARIEGAEIERSIILPRASIVHIGGRLVGSIVGEDARVFRDFSLPKALRLNVGDGGEVALC
ncbi:MAG TPA: hypothetical protein VNV37_00480 [Solirubrobacteraceae bacterium]|jgi:glucose-1-phosphate thymidylyltransferase|nr:hypothetical protein [Solirubrobacteraceae bacterium]